MKIDDIKLDSPEGMRILIDWARAGGYVLSIWHKDLAKKHGVDTSGVMFTEAMPVLDDENMKTATFGAWTFADSPDDKRLDQVIVRLSYDDFMALVEELDGSAKQNDEPPKDE